MQNFTVTLQIQRRWTAEEGDRPHCTITETGTAETLAEAIADSQKRWPAPEWVITSAEMSS